MKRCYDCGIPFSSLKKEERTKEHIPAQTFFNGYPLEYKDQRKTVPACYKCNQKYAVIDDQLRDLIGVINEDDPQKVEITKKAVRKIFDNKKDLSNRISFEEKSIWFSFDMNLIDQLHKKNFKGIYTNITKQPLLNSYSIDVYSIGQDQKKLDLGEVFISELKAIGNWDKSGNEKVFKFKMCSLNIENTEFIEFDSKTLNYEPDVLVCAMEYNLAVVALVVAMKPNM